MLTLLSSGHNLLKADRRKIKNRIRPSHESCPEMKSYMYYRQPTRFVRHAMTSYSFAPENKHLTPALCQDFSSDRLRLALNTAGL